MVEKFQEKVQGAFLGFALGDAMGMPVKGLSPQEANLFFKDGISPRDGVKLKAGQFTSHTLMLLKTTESFLEKGGFDPQDIAQRALAVFDEGIFRGMGSSTQAALKRIKRGLPWQKAGDYGPLAIGRGALMRTLPVALWTIFHPEKVQEMAATAAMITHQSDEAISSSLAFAIALQDAFQGQIRGLFSRCLKEVKGTRTFIKLKQAQDLLRRRVSPPEAIQTLGNSGTASEVVSSAIYSFYYFPSSFRDVLSGPLLAGGDAPAVGAIAGALSGAYLGLSKIPGEWLNLLEKKEEILSLSERFAEKIPN
ncbi:MAG: ADP-ribosylglycohydrolase family protein [Caldiserica bacterium]|jgi:poly(ADP-ribose) glycohydrolase ARH3|nr:ADP-ribosylglycohydrolase family protein [Caldisericota bacterium]MDH7562223.1 ADP-ribosylglycohydrolase family protein [Caldisericota bacterium]